MSDYYSVKSLDNEEGLELSLEGSWTIDSLINIDKSIIVKEFLKTKEVIVNGKKLKDFDTSAAWYLNNLKIQMEDRDISVTFNDFKEQHNRIYERVASLPNDKLEPVKAYNPFVSLCNTIGKNICDLFYGLYQVIGFLGQLLSNLFAMFLPGQKIRLGSIVFHLNEVGIKAIPIISLMAFSIALVTGYQGAVQLEKFGATVFTVDLVVLSTLREMGVLLTAIMLAGRSGSAFAAQIGTMKLNGEVDALQTMGVSPFNVLVLPRVIAILIALPLLTFIANVAGLVGAYVFSSSFMEMSYTQFIIRLEDVAGDPVHFWVGMAKAPVFALLIGVIGCLQGLQVEGSSEEVGKRTTMAVVQSIFLVIVADAIFSIVFTKLGI